MQGHLACPLLVDVVTEQAPRLSEPWLWLLVNGQCFLFVKADGPGGGAEPRGAAFLCPLGAVPCRARGRSMPSMGCTVRRGAVENQKYKYPSSFDCFRGILILAWKEPSAWLAAMAVTGRARWAPSSWPCSHGAKLFRAGGCAGCQDSAGSRHGSAW